MNFTAAQERLIEKYRYINVDYHGWWEWTLDDFVRVAKLFGVDVDEDDIQFRGFWSQGDGASFTFIEHCSDIVDAFATLDVTKEFGPGPLTGYVLRFHNLAEAVFDACNPYAQITPEGRRVAEGMTITAKRVSGHYCHSGTVRASLEYEYAYDEDIDACPGLRARLEELGDEIDELVERIADALYDALREEYEYLTSDEAVWETI
ncbi:hypothetical protein LPJ08_29055, partial [Klebsiella pneumoniae]|nr:hypothetical protein [Klebsiella pneumoniae]